MIHDKVLDFAKQATQTMWTTCVTCVIHQTRVPSNKPLRTLYTGLMIT